MLLTETGDRTMAKSSDPATMARLIAEDAVGTAAEVDGATLHL
jgi:hypothetical protein